MRQGPEYVSECTYRGVMNFPGFRIWQVSAYASVTQGSEYAWIWLNAWISCSDYGRVINMPGQSFTGFWICLPILNMPGFRIWKGCEYARVTQGCWLYLNKPECDLIILTMLELDCVYVNKQSSKYARILNVSDAVHTTRSQHKLQSSYRNTDVLITLSNISDGAFGKRNNARVPVRSQKFFRAWTVLWNKGTLINISSKTQEKRKHFAVFLQDNLKITFWMENVTQKWTQSWSFFLKSRHFFSIFKKRQGKSTSYPLVAHIWVWLAMHQYPWISPNNLGNAWINRSYYVTNLNMADHLSFSTGFWWWVRF